MLDTRLESVPNDPQAALTFGENVQASFLAGLTQPASAESKSANAGYKTTPNLSHTLKDRKAVVEPNVTLHTSMQTSSEGNINSNKFNNMVNFFL